MGRLPVPRCFCPGLAAIGLLLFSGTGAAAPDVSLQVSVNPEVPAAGQLVEIRVIATNVGTSDATDFVILDTLPAEVAIPAGMTHFASTGTYSVATGQWLIGTLAPAANAGLTIPVIVVGAAQPACIVNVARATTARDMNPANDRASAAIRRADTYRCADLRVDLAWLMQRNCGIRTRSLYYLPVYNDGPDDATNVIVDVTQTPAVAPGLEFITAGCEGTRCVLPRLGAGSGTTLEAESDRYYLATAQPASFTASVSSEEIDYATDNNQRTDELLVLPSPYCDSGQNETGMPLSGCFVATAAYGSPLEPHVQSLREFRDGILSRSRIGREFIDWYYRISPPVAELIRRHPPLRAATRAALAPVVFAVEHPRHAALGALSSLLLGLGLCARRRATRHAT